jgi:transglutaminase-like putative cysteine protease
MTEPIQAAGDMSAIQTSAAPNASTAPRVGSTRLQIDSTLAYELDAACDFVFQIHASAHANQAIANEQLLLEPATPYRTFTHMPSGNRFLRLQAQAGPLRVIYRAVVQRTAELPDLLAPEVAVHDIPDNVLRFLMPTRYCESDLLARDALQLFGALPRGYPRVQAISEWVRGNIEYRIGSTTATTTARDVFVQRAGVCRDYAHLAVTFCRALNIPARLVSGYARFPEPPPDFHAIFEAYLGAGWVLFDPSGMAQVDQVVRVATGRDAKDVAFATIFGPARMVAMSPEVMRLDEGTAAAVQPGSGTPYQQTGAAT